MDRDKSKIEYRESIYNSAETESKIIEPDGLGYGHVWLRVEPIDYESSNSFKNEIVGNVVPNEFINSIEEGIKSSLIEGPIAGFPMLGVSVALYDGSYHENYSNNEAFYKAAQTACNKAILKATPILLEPIMEIRVVTPEEFMGDIMGQLNRLRGLIHGMKDVENGKLITSDLPQSELDEFESVAKKLIGEDIEINAIFKKYDRAPSLPGPDGNEPSSMAISVA